MSFSLFHRMLGLSLLLLWTMGFLVTGLVNNHYSRQHVRRSLALRMKSPSTAVALQTMNETTVISSPWIISSSSSSIPTTTTQSEAFPIVPQQHPAKTFQTTIHQFANQYMDWLDKKPLLTKAITATLVQISGDVMSQHLVAALHHHHHPDEFFVYDPSRTLCFALIGFFYKAPMLHSMYRGWDFTGKYLQKTFSLTRDERIAAELVLDQTVGVFLFYPTYFYAYEIIAAVVHGHSVDWSSITVDRMTAVALPNYAVWPLAQYLSFRYVPEPLRVLMSNIVAVFYNIILLNIIAGG